MLRKLLTLTVVSVGFVVLGMGLVFAQEPTYTASPSASLTPTVTLGSGLLVSCKQLRIVRGQGSFVPAEVEFLSEVEGEANKVKGFRYTFGDGEVMEATERVTHMYRQAGEYEVRVEVQDLEGRYLTSEGCAVRVTAKAVPIVTHRAECVELQVLEGEGVMAPVKARFLVVGADNKGELQGYRMNFGGGETVEQTKSEFEHEYVKAGTFSLKADVKDSEGNWVEGTDRCIKEIHIGTGVMETQPQTGVATYVTFLGVAAIGVGLLLRRSLVAYHESHEK
jgi:PKD repeat protein